MSRLGVLLGGPPLSLVDMLLSQLKGVQEHDVPLVVCPSQEGGGSFVFLEMWVVPFRSLYSPFLGCFGFFLCVFLQWLAGFSSLSGYISPERKGLVRCRTHITQGDDEKKESPAPLHLNGLAQSPKFLRYKNYCRDVAWIPTLLLKKESSKMPQKLL